MKVKKIPNAFVALYSTKESYTETDVNAPYGWIGSGCYDVEMYSQNILVVTISALDVKTAVAVASSLPKEFLEKKEFPSDVTLLGVFQEPRISLSEEINELNIDEDNTFLLLNDDDIVWTKNEPCHIFFKDAYKDYSRYIEKQN